MFSLSRSRSISIVSNLIKVHKNAFFTEFDTKLQRFNKQIERYKNQNIDIAICQKVIEEVTKKEKLDTNNVESIKTNLPVLIHLGRTQHIPLIFEVIKLLQRNGNKELKYHTSFVRLVYNLNQIDAVIDLLNNPDSKKYFVNEDLKTMILVLDKLVEEKRFDQVWKFYVDHVSKLGKIPSSFLNAVTFSLMRLNTSESFAKMKELVAYCDKKNHRFGVNSVVQIFMTAILQKDYLYAINFLVARKSIHQNLFNNLIAIVYSCQDEPLKALHYAKSAVEINRIEQGVQGYIFRTTLNYLDESVKRCKGDRNKVVIDSYENLKKIISDDKSKLKEEDIIEFYSKSTEGTFSKTFKPDVFKNYQKTKN